MAACSRIHPKSGNALEFTPGSYQYGKDVDGFWKINVPGSGVHVVPAAAAIELNGDLKVSGQIMLLGGKKGSFVNGTWTDQ